MLHGSRLRFAWSSVAGAIVLALGCLSLVAQSRQPAAARPPAAGQGTPIKVLFVGSDEDAPHNPSKMFPLLAAPLARRGIQITYGRTPAEALDAAKLAYYDAVMIYGDRLALTPVQEKVLSSFVDEGHGVVALHAVGDLALVGAKLQPQGGAEFTAEIVQPANPVVQGLQPFAAWEEPVASAASAPGGRTVIQMAGRYSPFSLLNRLLPDPLAEKIVQVAQKREPESIFPAVYDNCSHRALSRILRDGGWADWRVEPLFFGAGYVLFSKLLTASYVAYEEWAYRHDYANLAPYYLLVARRAAR